MNGGHLDATTMRTIFEDANCCSGACDLSQNQMLLDVFDGICTGAGTTYDRTEKLCKSSSPPPPHTYLPSPPPLTGQVPSNSIRRAAETNINVNGPSTLPWLHSEDYWSCDHSLTFNVDQDSSETLNYQVHDIRSHDGNKFVMSIDNNAAFTVQARVTTAGVQVDYTNAPHASSEQTDCTTESANCVTRLSILELLIGHLEATLPFPKSGTYTRERDELTYVIQDAQIINGKSCVIATSDEGRDEDNTGESFLNATWTECRYMTSANHYVREADASTIILKNDTENDASISMKFYSTCAKQQSVYDTYQSALQKYTTEWGQSTQNMVSVPSVRSSIITHPWKPATYQRRSLQQTGPTVSFEPNWIQVEQNLATLRLFGKRYRVKIIGRLMKQKPEYMIFARLTNEKGVSLQLKLFSRSLLIDNGQGELVLPPILTTLFSMPKITLFSFGPLSLTFKPTLSAVAELRMKFGIDRFEPSVALYVEAKAELMLWTPCFVVFKAGLGVSLYSRILNNELALVFQSNAPGVALWNAERICVTPQHRFLAAFINLGLECKYCKGWLCKRCKNCLKNLLENLRLNIVIGANTAILGNNECGVANDSTGSNETWILPPSPPSIVDNGGSGTGCRESLYIDDPFDEVLRVEDIPEMC